MTIQGAIAELQNLLNADDVPMYYKGGIEKVIETIAMEFDKDRPSNSEIPNNCELQTIRCPKCGRTDYIRDMEKDMGIKGSHYKYKCINCNTYIKDEPQTYITEDRDTQILDAWQVHHRSTTSVEDEPQTCDDCIWNVCNYNKAFEDEPSEDCELCKHFKYRHPYWECEFDTFEECNYEPKTEPQTEVYDYKGNGKWERSE